MTRHVNRWDAAYLGSVAIGTVSPGHPVPRWMALTFAGLLTVIAVRLWRRGYGEGRPTTSTIVELRLADLSPEQREDVNNANRQIRDAMRRLAQIQDTQQ